MRALFDTNVILDVWLLREPFWRGSAAAVGKVELGAVEGYLCPTTITTLHYLGRKQLGEALVRERLFDLLSIFKLGELSADVFHLALESRISDFEDAVIESVAVKSEIDVIVTRNVKDFKHSTVSVIEPLQLLK